MLLVRKTGFFGIVVYVCFNVFCTKLLGDLLYFSSIMWLDLASVRSSVAVKRGSPPQLGQSRLPLCFIYGSDSHSGVHVTRGYLKTLVLPISEKTNIILKKMVLLIYNLKNNF